MDLIEQPYSASEQTSGIDAVANDPAGERSAGARLSFLVSIFAQYAIYILDT